MGPNKRVQIDKSILTGQKNESKQIDPNREVEIDRPNRWVQIDGSIKTGPKNESKQMGANREVKKYGSK